MKTTRKLLIVITIALLLFSTKTFAQEDAPKGPEYITVTTMHWNMEYKDFDKDTWIAVEKEFLDKVTKKNEYIVGAGFYWHRYTPDNREVVYVQSFASWEDINKAGERNNELIEQAWPDEDARDLFFKKQSAYYSNFHSDEIYATIPGAKLPTAPMDKEMITYVRVSHFAFPEDGTQKEFKELRMEGTKKIIHQNEHIKAYFPSVHAWGADRTEFVEVFYLDSEADLDKMFNRSAELVKAAWPDDDARKERGKKMGKYFTGVHGDYIYTFIPELSK
ncbi:hypothetical protein A9Q86_15065 [Flavobacteriales bacterium 33_180_T64]|nr:hypothetical protein A9Q86_15065 [Flavobacteriales bacterium 33_180_T64]